jgi:membrane dipeptidase
VDRRSFIGAGLALGAAPVLAAQRESAAAALVRRTTVIDGNLVVPLDDEGPVSRDTAAQVRASGLSVMKLTMGGPGTQALKETLEEIDWAERAIAASPKLLMRVTRVSDFARAKASGRLGIILSFEASEMLEARVDSIDRFAALGIKVMGLSYNRDTPFASGVMSTAHGGLTPLGREAVARMNALGVTVDVSHSDEPSSLAAVEASAKPVLITHAGSAAVRPHPRNKSDALMRALADKGGVIGIYELSYLAVAPAQPTMDVYMAHLTRALDVCGEDGVGIGSDASLTRFDTSPANMKRWNDSIAARKASGVAAPGEGPPPFVIGLNRSDRYLVVAEALLKRGYTSRAVEKVLGGNFARVFAETWGASGG